MKGSLHDAKTFMSVALQLHGRLTVIKDRCFMNRDVVSLASDAGLDALGGCIENANEMKAAVMKWREGEIERAGQIIVKSSGSVLHYRGWKERLFGRKRFILVTLDPSRRSEERGSTDLLLKEATDKPVTGRIAELREELSRIAIPSSGRRNVVPRHRGGGQVTAL